MYRSATSVFAPALARSPRGRVFGCCTVTQRSYSLPRDLSTTLEMTRRGSVSFYFIRLFCKYGHRRLAIGGSPTGGRGTPLPRSIESKYGQVFGFSYSLPRDLSTSLEMTRRGSVSFCFIRLFCKCGHRRLAIGGSPTGGRGTPLPRSIESKYGQVFGFSCSLGFIPIAGDFSTNARNDNVFTWFYCYFDRFCRSGRGTPLPFKAFPLGGATRRCEAP